MSPSQTDPAFLGRLADLLRNSLWILGQLRMQAQYCFPDDRPLVDKAVLAAWEHFGNERPTKRKLAAFLKKFLAADPHVPENRTIPLRQPSMVRRWPVPELATSGKLAEWLKLPLERLDWLADLKGLTLKGTESKLRHYVNVWVPRRRGRPRLLEVPKSNLKAVQQRILHEILDAIPPHEAAHGFRKGRSITTYVRPHVGRRIVLRFDLRDFFPAVTGAKVSAIFRTAGSPPAIARLLTGLCTTRTPREVTDDDFLRRRHLPQGAPTSPALANLAAFRLDLRLAGLAQRFGATYTRYADDLAFSGDYSLERGVRRFRILVAGIAAEEGFELNHVKSRCMRRGVRQQLGGIVVNVRPNLRRENFDELKAILHNCIRHGPAGQNRDGHADFRQHLLGRIAYATMLHEDRGARLRKMFRSIVWNA